MTTHVILITDMSGSMNPLAADVRGGFNGYIEDLKKQEDVKYSVSATLFDTEFIKLCQAVKLGKVPELTTDNYMPRGATALLDAVGSTVNSFRTEVKLKKHDKVLVMIQTDGQENSSREYTLEQVQTLIKELRDTGQWDFIYIGEGSDSWDQGHRLVGRAYTVHTNSSPGHTHASYGTRSGITGVYAQGMADGAAVVDLMEKESKKVDEKEAKKATPSRPSKGQVSSG